MKKLLSISFVLIAISLQAQDRDTIPWVHTTSVYQIYPRSYYDSDGDGIGDIQGIIRHLDYIHSLGFETIWCSPFFKSPQRDFGYDISDYTDIAPEYGTLKDARQLIDEVHKRGMKIVFDMVMNHTSDEHPWFKESASSRTNPKADYYLWRDKPNQWRSTLKAKGWHYVKARDQYYWASFLEFQPDLNYRNPEVKKKMFDAVRFWLARGVDGFRLDMFNSIYKDSVYRNNGSSRRAVSSSYDTKGFKSTIKGYVNQPESFGFSKELRSICDSFGDRMLLGEVYGNHQMVRRFLGEKKNDGIGLVFNFEMLRFKFKAPYFHHIISDIERDFPDPFMPVYVFSNHDRRRSMRRLKGNIDKAKIIHMLQLTVRGVPCMYYGEEIGMSDGKLPYKTALDPLPHLYPGLTRGLVELADETLNRDDVRTPMQWDSSQNGGFSTATKTWLPVNDTYHTVNVATEEKNVSSLLNFIKRLLTLRNKMPVFSKGNLTLINEGLPSGVLGYKRKLNNTEVVVLLNFSNSPKEIQMHDGSNSLLSVHKTDTISGGKVILSAYGGMVIGR
jgi:oligo-1,6-glucosidase/alpha-glucosidase